MSTIVLVVGADVGVGVGEDGDFVGADGKGEVGAVGLVVGDVDVGVGVGDGDDELLLSRFGVANKPPAAMMITSITAMTSMSRFLLALNPINFPSK
jgi:hypothetical protein